MRVKTPEFEPGGYWSPVLGADISLGCWARVYFRVYESWGGWSRQNGPVPRALTLAKKSHSLDRYVDTLIHEVISLIIKRTKSRRRIGSKEALLARIRERMLEEIAYSASKQWDEVDNPGRATLILHRHLVGGTFEQTEIERAIKKAQAGLEAFLLDYLPEIAAWPSIQVEVPDKLKGVEYRGFTLFASPDLVLTRGENDDEWVLLDWRVTPMAWPELLSVHALTITHREEQERMISLRPEQITGRSIPLLSKCGSEDVVMSEDKLGAVAAKIDADIDALAEKRPHGIGQKADLFPKTTDQVLCNACVFRFHCKP